MNLDNNGFEPEDVHLLDALTTLDKDVLAQALAHIKTIRFETDDEVQSESEAGEDLCIILEGQVKLYSRRTVKAGTRHRLTGVIGQGEVFGGLTARSKTTMFHAVAATPVHLATIKTDAFWALCTQHPEFAALMVQALSRITVGLYRRNEALLVSDAPGRLAWTISEIANRLGTPGPDYVWLSTELTQTEWAQLSGATRETINKAFGDFQDKGWLSMNGRGLKIYDMAALRNRAF